MEDWILNWTGFILSNTHACINNLCYEDGPAWIYEMFELWKKNSDHGQRYQEQQKQGKQ